MNSVLMKDAKNHIEADQWWSGDIHQHLEGHYNDDRKHGGNGQLFQSQKSDPALDIAEWRLISLYQTDDQWIKDLAYRVQLLPECKTKGLPNNFWI